MLPDRSSERIRDATWALVKPEDLAGRPVVVVTTSAARRALRKVLAPELPNLAVLANGELPLRVERQTVGTIEA
jgi:flagellar biosynthesis component FlhA